MGKKEKAKNQGIVKHWLRHIEKAKLALKEYKADAEKAAKAARDTADLKHTFNIWWSSCQITQSAIYSNRPKPDVRRRYQKPDPEEKELARLVERAIEYNIDSADFETPSSSVVRDYVQTGLGIPRLTYDVQTEPAPDPVDPQAVLEAAVAGEQIEPTFGQGLEKITSQSVGIEHVPWSQFIWEPGKSWKEVDWVAFQAFKSAKEIEKEFGIVLQGGKDDEKELKADEYVDLATIWEIWHKPSKTIYVICPNHPQEPLDTYKDELSLSGFFPIPRPLMSNVAHDELIPKPDYCFVQAQIEELNKLASRRKALVASIRDVELYDASLAEDMSKVKSASDGASIPVNGLANAFQQAGGDGAIIKPDNNLKIQTVREVSAQIEEAKDELYEILGLSDIVRGASEASETATAQQIKAQYANIRLNEKQGAVARLWREVFRMMAEVICEHFEPMQLYLMTGIEVTDRMTEIMQNDIGRSYSIDIETDSTVAGDAQEERKQTIEMITEVVSMMERLIPGVQSGVLTVPFVQEVILMALQTHKHGKNLEDAVQEMGPHLESLQQVQQQMQQMQQQLEQQGQQMQQMGQENQGLQQQLAQFNERKEAREDKKVDIQGVKAQADSLDKNVDNTRDNVVAEADIGLKEAQAAKAWADAAKPNDLRVTGL